MHADVIMSTVDVLWFPMWENRYLHMRALSIYPSVCLSIYMHEFFIHLFESVAMSVCLSVSSSINPFLPPCVCLFISQFAWQSFRGFVSLVFFWPLLCLRSVRVLSFCFLKFSQPLWSLPAWGTTGSKCLFLFIFYLSLWCFHRHVKYRAGFSQK